MSAPCTKTNVNVTIVSRLFIQLCRQESGFRALLFICNFIEIYHIILYRISQYTGFFSIMYLIIRNPYN
jgi:hypothetical protein